jgi:Transglycosylase SLT domain
MNLRTRLPFRTPARPPIRGRRPALYLTVAAAGALMVNVLTTGGPAASADSELASVSIAEQLGIPAEPAAAGAPVAEAVRPLEQLAASRSERDADRAAAALAQAAAEQAELDARAAAEEAARVAAEQAAAAAAAAAAEEATRAAEEQAAAARPGQGTDAPVAPKGSYKEYAMGKLGGAGSEFSCLENLWGKESGWNPNAQNPSSTAYGIAQFLNSTWAGTGIAKTSDGYRQIDAGLIYIEKTYGSPCKAWAKSQSSGWY